MPLGIRLVGARAFCALLDDGHTVRRVASRKSGDRMSPYRQPTKCRRSVGYRRTCLYSAYSRGNCRYGSSTPGQFLRALPLNSEITTNPSKTSAKKPACQSSARWKTPPPCLPKPANISENPSEYAP